jgi:Zn-dependent metalloprotease
MLPILVHSQNAILFSDTSQPSRLPSAIIFKEDSVPLLGPDRSKFFQSFLPLSTSNELRLISEQKDDNGLVHQFFGQYYQGIRVIDGQYVLHTKDSRVFSMNGNFQPISNLSVLPSIAEKDALTFALNNINASKYKWQIREEEILLQEQSGVKDTTYFPKGTLVITSNNLSQANAHLNWHIYSLFMLTNLLRNG